MEEGQIFAKLMAEAIEQEELELGRLKKDAAEECKVSENTIRVYDESWIWPAFLKQALRNSLQYELHWEKEKVDCCFLAGKQTIARFELKPFFPVSKLKTAYRGKILEDFEKQWQRAKQSPSIKHYVVLVPHGAPEDIERWVSDTLVPDVRKEYPEITVEEVVWPNLITLNRPQEGKAIVKVFRITSA